MLRVSNPVLVHPLEDADGVLRGRPPLVRVNDDVQLGPDRLADLLDDPDVVGRVAPHLDLDRLDALRDRSHRLVDRHVVLEPTEAVCERDLFADQPTEQLIDGDAERLALDVVERLVHRRLGVG